MKGIVAIKTSPSRPVELIKHCYRSHGREGDEIEIEDRVVQILHNFEGIALRDSLGDLRSLLMDHHGKGRLIRHVVISLEDCIDPEQRKACFQKLGIMAKDFTGKYCPDSNYIAVVHGDRAHPHCHLIVANSDKKKLSTGGQRFFGRCKACLGPSSASPVGRKVLARVKGYTPLLNRSTQNSLAK